VDGGEKPTQVDGGEKPRTAGKNLGLDAVLSFNAVELVDVPAAATVTSRDEIKSKWRAHFAEVGDGDAGAAAGGAVAADVEVRARVVFSLVHAKRVKRKERAK
jgi:hypothetical protein